MRTTEFIVTSVVTGLAMVQMSSLLDRLPRASEGIDLHQQEAVVTIYSPPTLTQRAAWCEQVKPCKQLATAVVWEARGEPLEGRYAVAWVVRNRVEHKRWGSSVEDVIHQRKQFSFIKDKHLQSTPSEKDWTEALAVAYDVLNDEVGSPVWDSTHYHATSVNPKWAKELELVAQIGNHNFYR